MTAARAADRRDATAFLGHPRGLGYLAFTEGWERFSFYGMQTMLVLYMVGALLQPGHAEHVLGLDGLSRWLQGTGAPMAPQALASMIFGVYYGLAYMLPVLGGLIGDRWLGQHLMVTLGAVLMAIGHFLMVFEAPFLIALLLLVAGSGCLKGNLSTQVSSLYGPEDRRRTYAFQIYMMAINIGTFLAPVVCGTLGETLGWHYGFGAAGIGMLIGLVVYLAGHRHLPPDRRSERGPRPARERLTAGDWRRVAGLAIVFVAVTLYYTPGAQVGNVYPLWVKASVDRGAFGLTIPITWFNIFGSVTSMVAPPLLIRYWQWRAGQGREGDDVAKLIVGCAMCAAAYLLLAVLGFAAVRQTVWWGWLVLHHALHSLSYLFLGPVGLSLFARAAPRSMAAMSIGVFYLAVSIAGYAAGLLGRGYGETSPGLFWSGQAAIVAAGCLLLMATARPLRRLLQADPRC